MSAVGTISLGPMVHYCCTHTIETTDVKQAGSMLLPDERVISREEDGKILWPNNLHVFITYPKCPTAVETLIRTIVEPILSEVGQEEIVDTDCEKQVPLLKAQLNAAADIRTRLIETCLCDPASFPFLTADFLIELKIDAGDETSLYSSQVSLLALCVIFGWTKAAISMIQRPQFNIFDGPSFHIIVGSLKGQIDRFAFNKAPNSPSYNEVATAFLNRVRAGNLNPNFLLAGQDFRFDSFDALRIKPVVRNYYDYKQRMYLIFHLTRSGNFELLWQIVELFKRHTFLNYSFVSSMRLVPWDLVLDYAGRIPEGHGLLNSVIRQLSGNVLRKGEYTCKLVTPLHVLLQPESWTYLKVFKQRSLEERLEALKNFLEYGAPLKFQHPIVEDEPSNVPAPHVREEPVDLHEHPLVMEGRAKGVIPKL